MEFWHGIDTRRAQKGRLEDICTYGEPLQRFDLLRPEGRELSHAGDARCKQ